MKINSNSNLLLEKDEKLKMGDVFLWTSFYTGQVEIHTFHSDIGYGIKTFTDWKDGASMVLSTSGIIGKLKVKND